MKLENIPRFPIFRPRFFPGAVTAGTSTQMRIRGYTPKQIKKAYSFNENCTGQGVRIAVIEAYYNDFLQHDLDVFCKEFELPKEDVNITFPDGKSDFTLQSWITESSLDVQWIRALAPMAQIDVIFAKSDSAEDMFSAVQNAVSQGADVVCMSFGNAEFVSQGEYTQYFADSKRVFVASAGDAAGVVIYPSASPAVLSVGGTDLEMSQNGVRLSEESAWRFGGGGPSKFANIPAWQQVFEPISFMSGGARATPDVAFYADMNPGVSVYLTNGANGKGWTTSGGTSFSCAAQSAICACILQNAPKSMLSSGNIAAYFYALAGGTKYDFEQVYFNDITIGSNVRFSAKQGWDFCTGLGSPNTDELVKG